MNGEPAPDLSDLVQQARQRDEGAARTLMERLYPQVIKIVRGHLPRRVSEEDLVQMVFIKVFNHIHQYEGRVPFEHWVTRIAVNTCYSALKAERARPELRWADFSEEQQHILESTTSGSTDSQETEARDARELVHLLLEKLTPPERLVLTLLHLEEKSVAEVQAITGWGAPLVKVRAFRARKKLQRLLKKMEKNHGQN